MKSFSIARVRQLLRNARKTRVLVVGDVMLDQFIWGRVGRISPEAPVPVVEFERESFMPGGAANVARNFTGLNAATELIAIVGRDETGTTLRNLLAADGVRCDGLMIQEGRRTSVKTRIIAHQQQVVRVDREDVGDLDPSVTEQLLYRIQKRLDGCAALIVGDYGKGVVTQPLLDQLKTWCRARGIWLSLDPKPVHRLDLSGLSLITPNRKEAFELAGLPEPSRGSDPLSDHDLGNVADTLLKKLRPAVLLITLSDRGMLLCQNGAECVQSTHIPTIAREVYDVSGAGDTVIASFTLAIASGASPIEAAIFSNHAAGVVVGKFGTAKVTPDELLASFNNHS